jgi:hypothetical protein
MATPTNRTLGAGPLSGPLSGFTGSPSGLTARKAEMGLHGPSQGR